MIFDILNTNRWPAFNPSQKMEDKGTLEYALRPYRVEWEVLEEKHGAVLGMMEIFLGW